MSILEGSETLQKTFGSISKIVHTGIKLHHPVFEQARKMLVGILEAGRSLEELRDQFGTDATMHQQLLNMTSGNAFTFKVYPIMDGIVPEKASECEGWLITGSPYSVNDDLPWIRKTEELVRSAIAQKIPVVGICFGHQLVARALGGHVEKSKKGYGLGLQDYQMVGGHENTVNLPSSLTLCAVHEEQVTKVPKSGKVLATSPFCENAIIAYGDEAITIQPHSEYSIEYLTARIPKWVERGKISQDIIRQADQSLANKTANFQDVGKWLADFFLKRQQRNW